MIGTTLGPYRLEAQIGAGGMGTVFRAAGPQGPVAVKVVHPHLLQTPGFFKRFLREGEIGRRVRHANVVATLDLDGIEADGRTVLYIAMEYVEGQTLRDLLAELGRVPEELCRHVGREVAKGLAAIHAAGVVHRDVKPENVIISRCAAPGHDQVAERPAAEPQGSQGNVPHRCEHAVKVMDLGVARIADEAVRLSQTGAFVGSVQYAAPEQFGRGGAQVDHRADLHALGLVLYELATAQHPYQADDFRGALRRVLDETPRRPAEINPQLSPFFEEVVLRLLAKDADARFATADELARVLDEGERSAWWQERAKAIRTSTRRPLRRIRIPRETVLVGRDAEIARLRAAFDRAATGDGNVVLIEGEAGIGKSRLVDEFVGGLVQEGEDLNFLFGSYPPAGAATASGAFSTAYREQFGDAGLDETLREYLKPTPVLVPAFAALLRGETTPTGAEPLTKDSLQTVFVHATRALAAERPTVVLIDDLHFAPDEGRALFAALALAVPGHRVLLVGTARPGTDEAWLGTMERMGAARLPLARLGPKDLGRLLLDALKSEDTANALALQIATKSDGNPFFVFEILRGLRDGQFLTPTGDGTWVTSRVVREIQIPSSVLDLVKARVAGLAPEERDLLDVAACLGFEFDPLLVGEALGMARIPLLKRLARIERAHRLVRAAGPRYVFDHHQVQEALYASLPELLRAEYHGALAAALETRTGAAGKEPKDLDGAVCADLAEHWLEASQGSRAARYLDAAMTHLEKGYLNEAAVRLAGRALAEPALVTGRQRCELLLRSASWLGQLARADEERSTLDEAVALADATGDAALRAHARHALGWHLDRVSSYDAALIVLGESVELAHAAGDTSREARASVTLSAVLRALGRGPEAVVLQERQRALAIELGDRLLEASAAANGSFGALGPVDEVVARYERLLAIAHQHGDRRTAAVARDSLGVVLIHAGRFDEARAHVDAALALARQTGDRRMEAISFGRLSGTYWGLGRYADDREHALRHLALTRETGDRSGEATRLGHMAEIDRRLGDLTAARGWCERSLAMAREIGLPSTETAALHRLALVVDESGECARAEEMVGEALVIARRINNQAGIVLRLLMLGELRVRAADAVRARPLLDEALARARALGMPGPVVTAACLLGLLPGADPGAARSTFAEFERRLSCDQRMEARFLLWRATHDGDDLAEAKRLLDHLVAHAPPDRRAPMVANVRLHRDIAAAAAAAGL